MKTWAKEETKFLKDNYKKLNYIEISKNLERSIDSIYWKSFELGLKKGRWNKENKLNKQRIIDMLVEEGNKLGKSPSVRDVPIALKSACQRHFGSFNLAKKAAKLDTKEPYKILSKRSYAPSKELAYVTGLLLGDGSFRFQKSKHRTSYVIIYATKDKELMDFFLNSFEKWSGFKPNKLSLMKEGYKTFPKGNYSYFNKAYVTQICSKNAWEFLKRFKDKPEHCIRFFPDKHQNWLIKGLWDAEGCIRVSNSKYMRIHFSNKDKKIIELYKSLLKNFNFKYSVHNSQGCFNIDILNKKEKIRFIKLIKGITIKRKLSREVLKIINEEKL